MIPPDLLDRLKKKCGRAVDVFGFEAEVTVEVLASTATQGSLSLV